MLETISSSGSSLCKTHAPITAIASYKRASIDQSVVVVAAPRSEVGSTSNSPAETSQPQRTQTYIRRSGGELCCWAVSYIAYAAKILDYRLCVFSRKSPAFVSDSLCLVIGRELYALIFRVGVIKRTFTPHVHILLSKYRPPAQACQKTKGSQSNGVTVGNRLPHTRSVGLTFVPLWVQH